MWAGLDSNQRRLMPADLQSAPFDRFGTDPSNNLYYIERKTYVN